MSTPLLVRALADAGVGDVDTLEQAHRRAEERRVNLAAALLEDGDVRPRQLFAALAALSGAAYANLVEDGIDITTTANVSEQLARKHTVVPVRFEEGQLVVAMADPTRVFALDDLRTATGMEISPAYAARADIEEAINKYYRDSGEIDELVEEFGDDEEDDLSALTDAVEDAPIVRYVNMLISQAVADRASDIHIEPTESELVVRYRIDGVLHEVGRSPKNIHAGVVSRLKLMGEMDIAERRVPQDGRISLAFNHRPVDLRVNSLPTVHGEKVVMRILDKSSVLLELSDLGFLQRNYEIFERSFTKPYGMILVTGPTGSGKSTTLYATLNVLNNPEVNIVTVEDPVEYQLPGINQVQVNKRAGMDFAKALRAILRQDPDIVLVGETRDAETAQIAIEAALTGHLVLTTLHTNDAPSAVTRLTEMGVEPFLVGSSVDCVLAQRLARRLCSSCKDWHTPDRSVYESAGFPASVVDHQPPLPSAVGCVDCGHTGYRGRMAVHEVMEVDEQIQQMTVERASSEDIMRYAVNDAGMYTLRMDGLEKVLNGVTTLEEVGRVVV